MERFSKKFAAAKNSAWPLRAWPPSRCLPAPAEFVAEVRLDGILLSVALVNQDYVAPSVPKANKTSLRKFKIQQCRELLLRLMITHCAPSISGEVRSSPCSGGARCCFKSSTRWHPREACRTDHVHCTSGAQDQAAHLPVRHGVPPQRCVSCSELIAFWRGIQMKYPTRRHVGDAIAAVTASTRVGAGLCRQPQQRGWFCSNLCWPQCVQGSTFNLCIRGTTARRPTGHCSRGRASPRPTQGALLMSLMLDG